MAAGYDMQLRNDQLNAITACAGAGAKLVIYSGTRPATGGAATTVLATFTMGSPFAPAASNAVLTANLPADVNAVVTATATWARLFKADGTTKVMDLGVGVSGAEVIMNSTSLSAGVGCSITSFTIAGGNA